MNNDSIYLVKALECSGIGTFSSFSMVNSINTVGGDALC